MNFEKLSTAPQSVLSEITDKPEELKTVEQQSASDAPKSDSLPSLDDVLKGNEHTTIRPFQSPDAAKGATSPGAAPGTPGSHVKASGLLGAEVAINLMDSLLPSLLVAALYAINIKLRKSELQLTADEKNTLNPIVKQCLDTIDLNFSNPWHCLMFTCGIIYGSKVAEKGVIKWIDNMNEEKGKAKVVPMTEQKQQPVSQSQQSQQPTQQNIRVVNNNTAPQRPYTEDDIERVKREKKMGRDRAILFLNKQHNWQTV